LASHWHQTRWQGRRVFVFVLCALLQLLRFTAAVLSAHHTRTHTHARNMPVCVVALATL
jgi:hypothetical protein